MNTKVVLITANQKRHRWLAQTIAKDVELVAIVAENKPPSAVHPQDQAENAEDAAVITEHLAQRDERELHYFGAEVDFPAVPILHCARGDANTQKTLDWIQQFAPDAIMLYGSGIVKDPVASAYPKRMINLHLGLSPYYRGSGTNFFPLVHGKPECVGYTIHLATLDVDAGGILAQGRPDVAAGDGVHDLGCKTIIKGAQNYGKVLNAYLNQQRTPQAQRGEGHVLRRRDFNAAAVRTLWQNLENGMIEAYITAKAAHDAAYPIIE